MSDRPPRPDTPNVQYDQIATALREREQWVAWKYKWDDNRADNGKWTKVPLKPFVDSNPYASAADSETWGAFEQARAFHERENTDTDGVGFVFAADDDVVGIDLDDTRLPASHPAADGTERVEPAARSAIGHLGSFTEHSPSGHGQHIYAVGGLPPGGNKTGLERTVDALDAIDDPDDPNVGPDIEMYDEDRFFTVTGDHVDGTPTEVAECDDELADLHAQHFGTDAAGDAEAEGEQAVVADFEGDAAEAARGAADGLSDDELIERACGFNENFAQLWRGSTEGYPSQSEADLALCNHLVWLTGGDAERVDRLFRQSGLIRPKWDTDRGSQTYGELTISEALDNVDGVYDPNYGDGGDGGGSLPDSVRDRLVADTATASGGDGGGCALVDPRATATQLTFSDEAVGYGWFDGEGTRRVSNFVLAVNGTLKAPDGSEQVELTVIPANGETFTVQVAPEAFNEPRDFRAAVCIRLSTFFDGGRAELNALREAMTATDHPTRHGTHHIGLYGPWNSDHGARAELVVPDGVLTADGWTGDPDHEYIEKGFDFEESVALSPSDGDDYDEQVVRDTLNHVVKMRNPERFFPVLAWAYASTFKPLIHHWEGVFNHVGVTGDTGAGKSSTNSALVSLFGLTDDAFSADQTPFANTALYSATNSLPVFVDEYKPTSIGAYHLNSFHTHYRKALDGKVEQRGTTDQSSNRYPVMAPILLAGESEIQSPAERRRTIMTRFHTDVDDPTRDTYDAYHDLRELDPSQHALAWHQWMLDRLDAPDGTDSVRKRWETADETVTATLDAAGYDAREMDSTTRQGLQTVAFGLDVFTAFAGTMGVPAHAPARQRIRNHRDATLVGLAADVLDGDHRKSHLDEFVGLLSAAVHDDYLVSVAAAEDPDTDAGNPHYTVVNAGTANAEVRVHLATAYPKVRRYVGDHRTDDDHDLLPKADYDTRFAEVADDDDHYVESFSQYTQELNRCVGVHIHRAAAAVADFEPTVFGEPPSQDAHSHSAGDGEGAARLDGGDDTDSAVPADAEGVNADAERLAKTIATITANADDGAVTKPDVVAVARDDLGFAPDVTDVLLNRLVRTGRLMEVRTGRYRPM